MSEDKRFTIDQTTSDIIVCENEDMKFWVEDYDDIERMVNKMNELYEKSKRLEREVYKLKRERNASDKQQEKWESQAIKEIDELKRENKELKDWKDACLDQCNENSILWNEIFILMEQGAKPSSVFENYLKKQKLILDARGKI